MTFETFDTIVTAVVFGIPAALTVLGLAYMIHEKM